MSQPQKKLDFEKIKKSLHHTWDKAKALLAAVVVMIVAACLIILLLQSKSTANKGKWRRQFSLCTLAQRLCAQSN